MRKRDDLMRDVDNVRESMGGAAPSPAPAAGDRPAGPTPGERLRTARLLPPELLIPDPDQPRRTFDEEGLDRLARSLKDRGQLQPIRVRWDEPSSAYVILTGERRWHAARRAGLERLECVVHDGALDADERCALQLIENCLREDLPPLEQAAAYRSLMDRQGWSARRLADELALSHPTILRALALLDLPEAVRARVAAGTLAPSTAAEIARLEPANAEALAERAAAQHLTHAQVVEAAREVAEARGGDQPAGRGGRPRGPRPITLALDGGGRVVVHGATDRDQAVRWLRQAIDRLLQDDRRDAAA